jgi:TatA/E family protein of Tat protein translocase
MFGGSELIVILAVAFLLFGPDKMSEVGRSLGKAMREMQKARNEFMRSMEVDDDDRPRRPRP